ncbi:MAG: collagen triple helix repeat [Siphoviridae sp. ctdc_1]|nr:MAG: collagen triple helix repeat [Siphoviridae sp. ctdc_1]
MLRRPDTGSSNVELRNDGEHVQWKDTSKKTWNNLFSVTSLGGKPGRQIELSKENGFINWRYADSDDWYQLIAVSELSGQPGEDIQLTVADDAIQWKLDGDTAWQMLVPLSRLSAKPAEFRHFGDKIQWRITGEEVWNDLMSVEDISGDNGLSVELQRTTDRVQWRQTGGEWKDLFLLTDIKGDDAPVNNFKVGSVETLAPGQPAAVSITGTAPGQILNFSIPAGADGKPIKIDIGKVTTLSPGSSATVSVSGNSPDFKLDFGIPRGDSALAPETTVIKSAGRPVGTGFIVHATRAARVSYTFAYSLTATLALGQNITLVASVNGVEVARMSDAILLGLAGTLNKTKSVSFDVPAGATVLFTKTGTASVTASVISGQETLL